MELKGQVFKKMDYNFLTGMVNLFKREECSDYVQGSWWNFLQKTKMLHEMTIV